MAEEEKPPLVRTPAPVQLTFEEAGEITDHINRKAIAPNDACPVCGDPNNAVVENVYKTDALTIPASIGGLHQPLVCTVCYNCGYVRFFNRFIVDQAIEEHNKPQEPLDKNGS